MGRETFYFIICWRPHIHPRITGGISVPHNQKKIPFVAADVSFGATRDLIKKKKLYGKSLEQGFVSGHNMGCELRLSCQSLQNLTN